MTDQEPTQQQPRQERAQSPQQQPQQEAQQPQPQPQQEAQQPQRQPQQQQPEQPQAQQQPPAQTPRDREIIVTDRGGGSGPGMVIGVIFAIVALVVVGVLAFGYLQNGGSDSLIPGEININVESPSSE